MNWLHLCWCKVLLFLISGFWFLIISLSLLFIYNFFFKNKIKSVCGFFSFLKFLFVWLRVCLDTTYFAKNLKLIAENTVAKYFLKDKDTVHVFVRGCLVHEQCHGTSKKKTKTQKHLYTNTRKNLYWMLNKLTKTMEDKFLS